MVRFTRLSAKHLHASLLAALAIGAGAAWSAAALAQDAPPPGAYGDRDGGPPPPDDYNGHEDRPDVRTGPPVGYDSGYDYGVANDPTSDADPYYQYNGPPPRDPRAHEQYGLRHYLLPVTPRTPYYAGVRLYGDYGYGSRGYGYGCGCAYYRRRYNVYYNDFGIRGDSYRSGDNRRREDYGRGYGDW